MVHQSALDRLAWQFFEVELPVSSVVLKKAYHRQCLKLHPDIGGNPEEFKEMQAAYKVLTQSDFVEAVFSGEIEYKKEEVRTSSGELLRDLGLGLGPTTNGRDCPECGHRGYTVFKQPYYKVCPDCGGSGFSDKCRDCHGTGKFTQANSKRTVTCRRCGGSGKSSPQTRSAFFIWGVVTPRCYTCSGAGQVEIPASIRPPRLTYHKCSKCNGTGELPVWNPVIPKAAMAKHRGRK